jgi:hypothetical protein
MRLTPNGFETLIRGQACVKFPPLARMPQLGTIDDFEKSRQGRRHRRKLSRHSYCHLAQIWIESELLLLQLKVVVEGGKRLGQGSFPVYRAPKRATAGWPLSRRRI